MSETFYKMGGMTDSWQYHGHSNQPHGAPYLQASNHNHVYIQQNPCIQTTRTPRQLQQWHHGLRYTHCHQLQHLHSPWRPKLSPGRLHQLQLECPCGKSQKPVSYPADHRTHLCRWTPPGPKFIFLQQLHGWQTITWTDYALVRFSISFTSHRRPTTLGPPRWSCNNILEMDWTSTLSAHTPKPTSNLMENIKNFNDWMTLCAESLSP